ncbi:MAG: tetratricopeptide repeat protein [Verrucomicrobiae bacterium]|nr:tetratricopeptide repeat protein [Verrucomicrobiae bacterium]
MGAEPTHQNRPPVNRHQEALRAAVHMRQGHYSKALACLQKAVTLEPGSMARATALLSALGLVCSKLGDNEKALACYEQCLVMDSSDPVTLNIAGVLNYNAENYARAGELLQRAAELAPKSSDPLHNLALVFHAQGKTNEALEYFEKALEADPGHCNALLGESVILAGQKKSREAADRLGQARLIMDGKISLAAGEFEKATTLQRQAVLLHPDNPRTLSNLGENLRTLGRLDESIEVFKKAVKLDPDTPNLHIRLATTFLTAGDFKNGWREYEWRIKAGYLHPHRIPPDHKRWDGTRMDKENLLVICEQGYGDVIQFSRYLPLAKARSGANIKLVCKQQLAKLLDNSWKETFDIAGEVPPDSEFDRYVPLMSLPWLFGTVLETIPPAPYLKAAEKDIQRWAPKISALKGRKIGLSWAGNPLHQKDGLRSISFKLLEPLFKLKDISFVSLQKTDLSSKSPISKPANFHDWSAEIDDFADTAAIIACLDLVISVDTAVAHLSGALGQKNRTLLPFIPEWRWMRDTKNSPWYPSMRLLRQKKFRDWTTVIDQLVDDLLN